MGYIVLVPAYGKDYKTAAAVKAAWDAGKDFIIASINNRWHGKYCSKNDFTNTDPLPEGSYIRYNKLTQLTHINIWEESDED
jgi:hypothetical protein